MYIVGGVDGNKIVKSCVKFDSKNNTWKQIANLHVALKGASICNFNNNFIFRFGGY